MVFPPSSGVICHEFLSTINLHFVPLKEMDPDEAAAVLGIEMDATCAAEILTVMDYDDGAAAVLTDA